MFSGGRREALLLKALRREPVPRTPLWIMRQAGRYLPEYRNLRTEAGSFLNLCQTPELAAEATMQPIDRYALDAAIIFSDILIVPAAVGLKLHFTDGEGPSLSEPLRDEQAVAALRPADEEYFAPLFAALALVRARLPAELPLIGFAGGPFTLACYMIEGQGGEFLRARALLHSRPDLFGQIMDQVATATVLNLAGQERAGADLLMIFDSWAALAPLGSEQKLFLEPLGRIRAGLRAAGSTSPLIVFLRGREDLAAQVAAAGAEAVGVGWQSDLAAVRTALSGAAAVQGNLDPATLLACPASLREEVARVLAAAGKAPGHIFNLGHGISKDTDPDMVSELVSVVAELSSATCPGF